MLGASGSRVDEKKTSDIEFVCVVPHVGDTASSITAYQDRSAYCVAAGAEEHEWVAIEPAPVAEIQRKYRVRRDEANITRT